MKLVSIKPGYHASPDSELVAEKEYGKVIVGNWSFIVLFGFDKT